MDGLALSLSIYIYIYIYVPTTYKYILSIYIIHTHVNLSIPARGYPMCIHTYTCHTLLECAYTHIYIYRYIYDRERERVDTLTCAEILLFPSGGLGRCAGREGWAAPP